MNYGLYIIKVCHCRFFYCIKCTTLVGDVDNRDLGVYSLEVGEISPFSSLFCSEFKLHYK